jgi:murein DD-endopeptidase MepM/ murein hydrolase activator NlpD
MNRIPLHLFQLLSILGIALSACAPVEPATPTPAAPATMAFPTPAAQVTPLPTRPPYMPGELVDYIAQSGDTLPALAARFNTKEDEIRAANPVVPKDASTMPPGFPMKIPVYYRSLWGTPYQVIPDSLFVNGPAQVGFNLADFVNSRPGWLKSYTEQIVDGPHSGVELVDIVSKDFSVSPRLLLAILEYYSGALSKPTAPTDTSYILNYFDPLHKGVYLQLVWAANTLNNGYYAWRRGALIEFEHPDGRIERPDPWQNAGTVALQYLFSREYSSPLYDQVIGPGGLAQTYTALFGDPWENVQPLLPGSLRQPELLLPFERGKTWNLTGGPHTGWGKGEPYAAVDFAPTGVSECNTTTEWVAAMSDGVVVRSQPGEVLVDLDGDKHEETGWVLFYLHISGVGQIPAGRQVKTGDHIGHPSCEGGEATGTHVHIARKYNGEWLLADGPIPFNLEGWIAHDGSAAYQGTFTRFSQTVTASSVSEIQSVIKSGEK